ncbi:SHOCT domain-containing protein [Glutamicibacter sp.]|uniref:SHOCT domain-containing protein n=1 Tax=Glutamicibacter sp. TaxID=1931995 RepID=UPI003D6C3F9E
MNTALILSALPAHYGHGPGWFILIPIFWILLIGLIIFAARRRHWQQAPAGAESVLRERYARGEIDETEYRQRLEVLRTKLK